MDSFLNFALRQPCVRKIGSWLADLIFPNTVKTYRILGGPGKGLLFKLNARNETEYLFGTYENRVGKFLLRQTSNNTVFWDIGANSGYFSCILARSIRDGRVVAIEPQPYCINLLKEHAGLNRLKNMIIIEAALSSRKRNGSLIIADDSRMGRLCSKAGDNRTGRIEVAVTTADKLLERGLPKPTLIKIDAEGEEGKILEGAAKILKELRPSLIVEIHTPEAAKDCWQILQTHRYGVYVLTPGRLKRAEEAGDIYGGHIWAEPVS